MILTNSVNRCRCCSSKCTAAAACRHDEQRGSPALDPFFGFVLLLALLLGGAWVVRSLARSPDGQAIERRMSETGRSLRDRLFSGEQGGDPASKATDIVKERYARGQIDRDQYLQMLKDLDDRPCMGVIAKPTGSPPRVAFGGGFPDPARNSGWAQAKEY
jgi:hypothetical protein